METTYTDKDFEKLAIPVHTLPLGGGDIYGLEPLIGMYPEFRATLPKGLSKVKVLRYIGVLYQKNSPLLRIESLARRKVEAAKWAGFDRNKAGDRFTNPYMEVLKGRIPEINRMIIRICRVQKSPEFQRLITYESVLAKELEALMSLKSPKDIKETKANIDSFTADVEELKSKFLFEDDNELLTEELLDEIENEDLELSPEFIAYKRRHREELLAYNPYGDYQPRKITAVNE